MAERSGIEWTDATWNPVTGCTKISPGCKFCYAERLTERFGSQKFTEVRLHPDRLELPLRWRAPKRIFVNSMSDLFHETVPTSFIDRVFEVMDDARQHIFQVLTKRPDRLLLWHRGGPTPNRIPANVWIGVSVESQAYAWRIDRLRQVECEIRFISAEPLLGGLNGLDLAGIAWVITGGESGGSPGRALVGLADGRWQPKPEAIEWVRALRDLCRGNGVAFFHKQWGGPTARSGGRLLDGREWSQYPTMPRAHTMASR
ncbi:MAG: phage Gp37/Gp68 family protein [Candidatus Rokubacteria bacterium]|nr:phage Gp37/Gp68 family protein [Candidatus Rokubacteria bacterium]